MQNGINKISVYGDSILKGAVTGTESGHLFDIIEDTSLDLASRALGFELNNQSVFGSVASKTQRRLVKDLEKGVCGDLAILESGGNDCDYSWSEVCETPDEQHFPRTKIEDFDRIMQEMIDACRNAKVTPLVMTMPPLVADWWFEHISEGHDREIILKELNQYPFKLYLNHELYNMHLVEIAQKNNVQIVDMRRAMLEHPNYRTLMCKDGIHPNENGYRYMAAVWEKSLPLIKKEF